MRNSLEDLKNTLEKIRVEKHPEIPSDVINKIILAQAENQDNPSNRQADTERIIDEYLNSVGHEED